MATIMRVFAALGLLALTVSDVANAFKANILEALMLESLRDNRVQACDGETVTLHCPRNTHVLVQTVFYGRLVPSAELCPAPGGRPAAGPPGTGEDTGCDMPDAHTRVTDACRGKRKCRVIVRPSFFGERDACPTTRKYLQVSYKCKPISFEDQSFCEGTTMQLACRAHKRLSVYSAQYGRTVNGQAQRCDASGGHGGPPPPVLQDCVFDVLPQVLRQCHAKSDCALSVSDHFFGNPCSAHDMTKAAKQLSLIYMCVNDEVFSESALSGSLESMRALEEETTTVAQNHTSPPKLPNGSDAAHRKDNPKQKVAAMEELDLSDELNDLDDDEDSANDDYSYVSDDEKEVFLSKHTESKPTSASKAKVSDSQSNGSGSGRGTVQVESVHVDDDLDYADAADHPISDDSSAKSSTAPSVMAISTTPSAAGVIDPEGLGFAEDFATFVRYLKENHEESLLYFFLFIAAGLITLLTLCLCCHCRGNSSSARKRRFGLLITRSKPRRMFFGAKNYQTVSVSSGGGCTGAPTSLSSTASTSSTSSGGGSNANIRCFNNKLSSTNGYEPVNGWRRSASVASCKRIPYTARAAAIAQHHYDADMGADLGTLVENSTNSSPLYSDSDGSRLPIGQGASGSSTYMPYWDTYGSAYGIVSGGGGIPMNISDNDASSARPSFSRSYGTGLADQQSVGWSDYAGRNGFSNIRRPPLRPQVVQSGHPSLVNPTPQMRRITATPSADRYGARGETFKAIQYSASMRAAYDNNDANNGYEQHYATASSALADATLPRVPVSLHNYS